MEINFNKNSNGLLPAIIQDVNTKNVLMLGYMNVEAFEKTKATKQVTFYSRSKERLWTKGEESGNVLHLINYKVDCDHDTILIQAKPNGPVCHKGTDTCWAEENQQNFGFLTELESTINKRFENSKINKKQRTNDKTSYVVSLFDDGLNKIAQKVGEEAIEVVIEAKDDNDKLFLNESADLLFHYLILLKAKGFQLEDVVNVLKHRKQ